MMETKSVVQLRVDEEERILKFLKREILKSAKKGDCHYYWYISGLNKYMVVSICNKLEVEGRMTKNKGVNFKIIHW